MPSEGDRIRFAAKKNYSDSDTAILIQIPTDTMILTINPEDTKSLPFGTYVYDIELTYANGDVDTFICKQKFKIEEEVY